MAVTSCSDLLTIKNIIKDNCKDKVIEYYHGIDYEKDTDNITMKDKKK